MILKSISRTWGLTWALMSDLEGVRVPVVSVLDLIEMKMQAGRQQDLSDVEHLKIILGK
jgi:hypothetical protein